MGRLNRLGGLVLAVAASKFVGFVVTAPTAMAVSAVVIALAFLLANDYRRYDKELVRNTNLWGLLKLLSHAWQFWVAVFFFASLGIGSVKWTELGFWSDLASWVGAFGLLYEFLFKPNVNP
ncbi:hypothetical protein BGP84_12805 [Pseudomonas putida]|uniref:Uncharacterized protein n=2 Tax=Pseudomonas TaxID=286 RepID=A0A2S3X4U0_PSEPU|nr:hypothetical protein BGP84_12805 [Pseudomonas putida]POG16702.1 hypothetical protein BGP85_11310 [Pseudomonas putida]